jgi:CBS domain containing-hemolysin-like protein
VFDGTRDNIVGLVYAKVLFFNPDKTLRELVQPVRFVPELATCEQLLVHFRSTKTQLAIAVDEYGGVAGLVTLEDVIEQIVGELHDPEDVPDEPDIQPLPDGAYDISGQLSVHYWVETFALPPRVERVATVGGLVMARLGRPAQAGDVVELGNIRLQVTRVRRRRIERLQLRLKDTTEGGPGAE